MVILVLSFSWLVYGRYILNDTPTWVEQLAMLLVTTITFLSAAVGIHERSHLSVDIISHFLSPANKIIVAIVTDTIMLLFGAVMAWYAYELIEFSMFRQIPLLGVSESVRYVPVMASGCLIVLFSIQRVCISMSTLINQIAYKES